MKYFIDNNLQVKTNPQNLKKNEVDDMFTFSFEGKNDFINFYYNYNGVSFPNGAFFYRDKYYKISKGDYNMLDVGAFLPVSGNDNNTICNLRNALNENRRVKEYIEQYFPFAIDSAGNFFLIEILSGKIFYLPMENPDNVTEVAPSFLDFCHGIDSIFRN
jgi:hypothetical protein